MRDLFAEESASVADQVILDRLAGGEDGVHSGNVVGLAVTDDADFLNAEEGTAAVDTVVEHLTDAAEEEESQQGIEPIGLRNTLEVGEEALGFFEQSIAGESVADDDVGFAVHDVLTLDVADEPPGSDEKLVCLLYCGIALS